MDKIKEYERPKSIRLLKALLGCTLLCFLPGSCISVTVPSSTIALTRVNQQCINATVSTNVAFVFPIWQHTASDITGVESKVIDGGLIRRSGGTASSSSTTGKITGEAEDHGLLSLNAAHGEPIEVYISPHNIYEVRDEIDYFIKESKEPHLRLWVTDNWKFGVILPGGLLLFGVVALLSSFWAIIKGQPLRKNAA